MNISNGRVGLSEMNKVKEITKITIDDSENVFNSSSNDNKHEYVDCKDGDDGIVPI